MAFNFDRIKQIDQSTKDVVQGFIKQAQLLLPLDKPYFNIPSLVVHLVLMFYWNPEFFTKHGGNASIDEKRKIVCFSEEDAAYGNIEISGNITHGKYIWTFDVLKFDCGLLSVGIDSSNKQFSSIDWYNNHFNPSEHYSFEMGTGSADIYSSAVDCEDYGSGIHSNDTLIMELDFNHKTLGFMINDTDFGIAFRDIDFKDNRKYHMVVSGYVTRQKDIRIELADFQQCHN